MDRVEVKNTPPNADDPTRFLEALNLDERIDAVAADLKSGVDRFAKIDAFKLAELLEVSQPEQPDNSWAFTTSADIRTLEEELDYQGSASEMVYPLEKHVGKERFEELKKQFDRRENGEIKTFRFLTAEEREILERSFAEEQLEGNLSNGIGGIARYYVKAGEAELGFKGEIEEDGYCLYLMTPYDERDGRFSDFSDCVVEER